MDHASDDALMARVAEGDEAAFRILVERWERRIVAFLYRMTGTAEDAQDLAQETFLRLYGTAAGYEPRGRFAPYLFRIAGNLARNELRRRSVRQFLSLDWFRSGEEESALPDPPAPASAGPDEALNRLQEAARVRRALLSLPRRQREALVLQRYEDLTQAEIAEVLGVSESAVEGLLARGMAKLRKILLAERRRE